MKRITLAVLLVSAWARVVEADDVAPATITSKSQARIKAPAAETNSTPAAATNSILPPLPEGVVDLKFSEFFKSPVGPRGLEVTPRLQSLAGQKVRLLGYMIRQANPLSHCFLLASLPVKLHEHEYGFADELPASTVHVFTDSDTLAKVTYTPGLLLLTGTLSVGLRAEPDGRNSVVRLHLDPPSAEQRAALNVLPHQPTAIDSARGRSASRANHSH